MSKNQVCGGGGSATEAPLYKGSRLAAALAKACLRGSLRGNLFCYFEGVIYFVRISARARARMCMRVHAVLFIIFNVAA